MKRETQILIADDHPLLRQGLRQAIEADPQLIVVADVGDGQRALERLRKLRPAIAVLDVNMPGLDGFGVARAIRDEGLPVEIIFLTVYRERTFFNQALDLGAKGYILKDSASTDIVTAIKAVAAGEYFTSPALTSYLINRRRPVRESVPLSTGLTSLTPTERRVLSLIAAYKTSKEIAEELSISFRTVNTHRSNICQKLDLQGNHALMKFALAHQDELT